MTTKNDVRQTGNASRKEPRLTTKNDVRQTENASGKEPRLTEKNSLEELLPWLLGEGPQTDAERRIRRQRLVTTRIRT